MSNLKLGDQGFDVGLMQKGLREKLNVDLVPDGDFGPTTEAKLKEYQARIGVVNNGVYDAATEFVLGPYLIERFITLDQLKSAANDLSIDPAMLYSFVVVEGGLCGFLCDTRPKILFERHHFYHHCMFILGRDKADEIMQIHPDICNTAPGGYLGGADEWDRLARAMEHTEDGAIKSASWGLFQIMASNYAMCGYSGAEDFAQAMCVNETKHLEAVISFIKAKPPLLKALREKDFENIAYFYNGANYKAQGMPTYDIKLKNALSQYPG